MAAVSTLYLAAQVAVSVTGPITIKWRGLVIFNEKKSGRLPAQRIIDTAGLRLNEITAQQRKEYEDKYGRG